MLRELAQRKLQERSLVRRGGGSVAGGLLTLLPTLRCRLSSVCFKSA